MLIFNDNSVSESYKYMEEESPDLSSVQQNVDKIASSSSSKKQTSLHKINLTSENIQFLKSINLEIKTETK